MRFQTILREPWQGGRVLNARRGCNDLMKASEPCDSVAPTLEMILDQVPALPPATQILPKLLAALCDSDTDISRIAELVAFDPGLTVKLIQLCNSAALGGEIRVTDVSQAVNRVGVNCVFQLVAALTGNNVWKSPAIVNVLEADRIWEHSVTVALAAGILAKDKNENDSAAFTAGLLHESGKIVMAQAFREDYQRLLAEHADSSEQLVTQERAAYGFDYPEAGSRMLARQSFPEEIVTSIAHQHRPEEADTHTRAAALLSIANTLAAWARNPTVDAAHEEEANPEALRILDLKPKFLLYYCERIEEEFKFANALCQL